MSEEKKENDLPDAHPAWLRKSAEHLAELMFYSDSAYQGGAFANEFEADRAKMIRNAVHVIREIGLVPAELVPDAERARREAFGVAADLAYEALGATIVLLSAEPQDLSSLSAFITRFRDCARTLRKKAHE